MHRSVRYGSYEVEEVILQTTLFVTPVICFYFILFGKGQNSPVPCSWATLFNNKVITRWTNVLVKHTAKSAKAI